MKRLVTILLTTMLMTNCVYSSIGRVFALEDAKQKVTANTASPREILRGTYSGVETYAGNYKVRVTLNYTYRFEASNISQ